EQFGGCVGNVGWTAHHCDGDASRLGRASLCRRRRFLLRCRRRCACGEQPEAGDRTGRHEEPAARNSLIRQTIEHELFPSPMYVDQPFSAPAVSPWMIRRWKTSTITI